VTAAEPAPELPPEAAARRRAGQAIRQLGHAVVGHDADPRLLGELAGTLEALTARLRTGIPRSRALDSFADTVRRETPRGVPIESYDDRPFSGKASPWGVDLEVHHRGDAVEAELTLGAAHEGAPGRAHGGIVAGLFDDVFGFMLGVLQVPAFTGELKVRYKRPTPLHRRLRCTGALDRRDGRKLWITGDLVDLGDLTEPDGLVVATATGLFITVDPTAFLASQQLPAPPAEP